jgi:hypothetical protein
MAPTNDQFLLPLLADAGDEAARTNAMLRTVGHRCQFMDSELTL